MPAGRLFGSTMHWTVYDAVRGKIAEGGTRMADCEAQQPWPVGDVARGALEGDPQAAFRVIYSRIVTTLSQFHFRVTQMTH